MTKRIETENLNKKATEYALKVAIKSDKKVKSAGDKARFDHAFKTFFESYDAYMERG